MLISILVPTFNRQNLLAQALGSILKSNIQPASFEYEIIVLNDGSMDGTKSMLESEFPSVKLIESATNRGGSFVLNLGLKAAKGKWIYVLDDDDIILQRSLFNFYQLIQQNPEQSWFVFDMLRADEDLRYMTGHDYWGWEFKSRDEWLEAVYDRRHFIQHNCLFKRDLAMQAGLYDELLPTNKDIDLFIRFVKMGVMPYYSGIISHIHRFHGSNLSSQLIDGQSVEKNMENWERVKQKHFAKN
jgi:glycosyltransferase involved in cell wall biosynthesis